MNDAGNPAGGAGGVLVLEGESLGTTRDAQVARWLGAADRWLRMATEREDEASFRDLVDAASKAQARALEVAVMGGMGEKIIDLDGGAGGGKALRATRDRLMKIIQATAVTVAPTDGVSDGGELKCNELVVVECETRVETGTQEGGGMARGGAGKTPIGQAEPGISDLQSPPVKGGAP